MAQRNWMRILGHILFACFLAAIIRPAAAAEQAIIVVDTTADQADDGMCALREAITAANQRAVVDACSSGSSGIDVIRFAVNGTFNLTRSGTGEDDNERGDLDVKGSLIIEGQGRDQTIIDANGVDRVFHVNPGANLTLQDMTVSDGRLFGTPPDREGGAGLFNDDATMILENVLVTGNESDIAAGILNNGMATITGSEIENNRSLGSGGGIYLAGNGDLIMRDSLIQNNEANMIGGGLMMIEGSEALIEESSIVANRAINSNGGGVYLGESSSLLLRHSRVEDNRARFGGGIAVKSSFQLENVLVVNNEAEYGAGLFLGEIFERNPSALIQESEFRGNMADQHGGAIASLNPTSWNLDITASTFCENEAGVVDASGSGGALYLVPSTHFSTTIERSTFCDNQAADLGGAIYQAANMTIHNSTISGNVARLGAGIYNDLIDPSSPLRAIITLRHVTIAYNQAAVGGGGVYNVFQEMDIGSSIIANNEAPTDNGDCAGAAIWELAGSNLASDGSCPGFTFLAEDPLLNPLADNGGSTLTHLPNSSSPVVDAGTDDVCTEVGLIDQRDLSRDNVDGNDDPGDGDYCDLGAVEVQPSDGQKSILLPMLIG